MKLSISSADLPESQPHRPFGPNTHAVNDPNTLALGTELTLAAAAHRRKRATADQLELLRQTDDAIRQAILQG